MVTASSGVLGRFRCPWSLFRFSGTTVPRVGVPARLRGCARAAAGKKRDIARFSEVLTRSLTRRCLSLSGDPRTFRGCSVRLQGEQSSPVPPSAGELFCGVGRTNFPRYGNCTHARRTCTWFFPRSVRNDPHQMDLRWFLMAAGFFCSDGSCNWCCPFPPAGVSESRRLCVVVAAQENCSTRCAVKAILGGELCSMFLHA